MRGRDWDRRASPRKGAVPGLGLPPTHSYSRPEDMGPHRSRLQAAMDQLEVLLTEVLPQDLSDTLGGEGSGGHPPGLAVSGAACETRSSQASPPQTTGSQLQGPRNTGRRKNRLTVIRVKNSTILINNNIGKTLL